MGANQALIQFRPDSAPYLFFILTPTRAWMLDTVTGSTWWGTLDDLIKSILKERKIRETE